MRLPASGGSPRYRLIFVAPTGITADTMIAGYRDVTGEGRLPRELDGLLGWVACLEDARPSRAT